MTSWAGGVCAIAPPTRLNGIQIAANQTAAQNLRFIVRIPVSNYYVLLYSVFQGWGQPEAARAAWNEALRIYSALKMPQARLSPAWLAAKPG